MTDMMESKMLSALTGKRVAVTPAEVISREEMISYVQKYTPLIAVDHRRSIFRMIAKSGGSQVYSELPNGIAVNVNRLSVEIIAQIYTFIKHVRLS